MLVNAKLILEKANKENYALRQANMVDQHTLKAELMAAAKLQVPIMIGWAPVHAPICSMKEAAEMTKLYADFYSVPAILHLDHGESFEQVKEAIACGFTSVMFDGSSLPYEENVLKTKKIVDYAHKFGICVEAELGHVGSGEDYNQDQVTSQYTDPVQAKDFVEKTNIDSLAVAIGTAHGEYAGEPRLDYDRLTELKKAVPLPLVLHGSSGTGLDKLEKCVNRGINKVNICTDLLKAGQNVDTNGLSYLDAVLQTEEAICNCLLDYYRVFHTKAE